MLHLTRAGLTPAGPRQLCLAHPLPPYSPELNPVERIWEYLKERYLSHRLLDDYDAIEATITVAWNKLLAETGRLTSLTWLPWEPKETATATSQKL